MQHSEVAAVVIDGEITRICIVVAVAENGVIGKDGKLPWRLPSDLARFKELTLGKPVVMGRRTFQSLKRPLPGRTNIVMSRQPAPTDGSAIFVSSLTAALEVAVTAAAEWKTSDIMVIGGTEIFKLVLPITNRIYLTRVHATPAGDTWFPPLDPDQWHLVTRENHPAAVGDDHDWTFETLDRR